MVPFHVRSERGLSINLRVFDCAGRAQRRRRFAEVAPYRVSQSGVALRLPPQSKRLSRHYSTLQVHGPIPCAKRKEAFHKPPCGGGHPPRRKGGASFPPGKT